MSYSQWLDTQGLDINLLKNFTPAENKGLATSYANLGYGTQNPDMSNVMTDTQKNEYLKTATDPGFSLDGSMDWMTKNAKGIGAAAGLAGLGMGAYSTFFGQGKELHDKNMTLLNQQILNNQEAMDNRREFNSNWASASKSATDGLAKTSATKVG